MKATPTNEVRPVPPPLKTMVLSTWDMFLLASECQVWVGRPMLNNDKTKYSNYYLRILRHTHMDPFLGPLKKKWYMGLVRSRSQGEDGRRGRRNWHQMKFLRESMSLLSRVKSTLEVEWILVSSINLFAVVFAFCLLFFTIAVLPFRFHRMTFDACSSGSVPADWYRYQKSGTGTRA